MTRAKGSRVGEVLYAGERVVMIPFKYTNPLGDADGDGVPNYRDSHPLDKRRGSGAGRRVVRKYVRSKPNGGRTNVKKHTRKVK